MIIEILKFKNPKDKIADKNPTELIALKKERKLSLEWHPVKGSNGDDMITICKSYIKLQNTHLISENMPASILKSALSKLYLESNYLRTSDSDILALKIILGVNENNTTHFFYQPICLNLKEELFDAALQKQGVYVVATEGAIHDYNSLIFQPSALANHDARYKERVKIRHDYNDPFTDFIDDADVTSIIFSFQEMFSFIYDVEIEHPEFYIYNCVRKIFTGEETYDVKHSLLLATEKRVPPVDVPLLKGIMAVQYIQRTAYANLAHLCPPNCNRFLYPLEA